MFFLYCTEIAMFRFRCWSGISDYKNIFNAIIVTKIFIFLHVSVSCVLYPFIFAIKWVGFGLGVD